MEEEDDEFYPPVTTNTFGIPNDPELLTEYELYKPTKATRKLLSERKRETYAEAFIENIRLGTLSDLCVRALAKMGTMHIAQPVLDDPLKLRIHFDTLDVNLPLKECYFVDDIRFWQRVVLAKSSDKSLPMLKLDDYDWRGKGISIKFVEMVEECPAQFWPEDDMANLALRIKDYVRTMHIKHLQSLTDAYFEQFLYSDEEVDVTSSESEEVEISSDEPDTGDGEEEAEEEEIIEEPVKPEKSTKKKVSTLVEEDPNKPVKKKGSSMNLEDPNKPVKKKDSATNIEEPKSGITTRQGSTVRIQKIDAPINKKPMPETEALNEEEEEEGDEGGEDSDPLAEERRRARHERNAERQVLRDRLDKKRQEHERRRKRRSLMRKPHEEEVVVKKRKRKKKIKGVFDIEVEPEPEDEEEKIPDHRNKEMLLRRLKRYDYPPEHCHHIDLSFVRHFDNLVSFTLEFLGPEMGRNYHKRHLNFSYDDIGRLAKGLKSLNQLKIFRLRNSRMDSMKMQLLARALKVMESIEVIDLGYDQLGDDCGTSLAMLFEREIAIKALELEYNRLGPHVMDALGLALDLHTSHSLEYLGLAHNPLGDNGLHNLFRHLVGTEHVQELNISAVEASKTALKQELSFLLRNHKPLLRLDWVANPMDEYSGKDVIRALESNRKILHFDCRACDLDSEEEFEAEVICRRNNYAVRNSYLGDITKTEFDIMTFLAEQKHPIVMKISDDIEKEAECIKNRPDRTPSEPSIEEEEKEEEEYDIWAVLGIKTKPVPEPEPEAEPESSEISVIDRGPFIYDPNNFTLEEFREHVHIPGPPNRHYYFRQNQEPTAESK